VLWKSGANACERARFYLCQDPDTLALSVVAEVCKHVNDCPDCANWEFVAAMKAQSRMRGRQERRIITDV
jgi:hypothetical protein